MVPVSITGPTVHEAHLYSSHHSPDILRAWAQGPAGRETEFHCVDLAGLHNPAMLGLTLAYLSELPGWFRWTP